MAKLYLDDVSIENSVIPNLNNAINYLSNAVKECNKMMIPKDFVFEQYLKQLENNISITLIDLEKKKNILQTSVKNYKNIENKKIMDFSSINILDVPARRKEIK